MTEYGDLSIEFVTEERHVAFRQAGTQVVIELLVLLALVIAGVWLRAWGSDDALASTIGLIVVGSLQTAYDIRWWRWLRHAAPADAYRRLQIREDSFKVSGRWRLVLALAVWTLIGASWYVWR